MSYPMKWTVVIAAPGGPELALTRGRRPVPQSRRRRVLVRVAATGISFPARCDAAPGPLPCTRGCFGFTGARNRRRNRRAGAQVSGLSIGDKVTAPAVGRRLRHLCCSPRHFCLPVPTGISMIEAAAIPRDLFYRVDESIQACGGMQGRGDGADTRRHQRHQNHRRPTRDGLETQVFATAGSDDKARACESNSGAIRALNYRTEDFVAGGAWRSRRRGKGDVDVTLDMVAGSYVTAIWRSLTLRRAECVADFDCWRRITAESI